MKYILHPAFPEPERIVTNRKTGFKLSSAGWGEFRLRLAITLKNGKVLNRQHDLKLKYPRNPQRDGINPQRGDTTQVLGSAGTKTSAAPQLRVFLSSSVADAAIADAIKETLEQHGAKVVEADAVGPSFRPLVESMIRKADGIIGVLSPASGNSVHEELQLAERNGVPVWRIGVGSEPLVPEPHWRVDGPSDVASAVKRVEEMLASISNPPRQR